MSIFKRTFFPRIEVLKKSNEVYSVKKGTDKGFIGLFVANESFSRTRRLTTTRALLLIQSL